MDRRKPSNNSTMLQLTIAPGTILRLFEESDIDETHALVEANRDYLTRFMPWAATATREEGLEFIRSSRRQIAENNGLQTALVIDGNIAGTIGVHGINWRQSSTSIGYWLAERYQGRGVMTAAVKAYVEHAFGVWKLERMELRAATDNARSRAVAERVGFVQEGVLRHAERIGDHWHDLVVYGLLASDWSPTGRT